MILRLIQNEPLHATHWYNFAIVAMLLNKDNAVIPHLKRALELEPDHAQARYLLAMHGACDQLETAPAKYIEDLFDGFASHFEKDLERIAKRATPGQYKEHPNHVEQSDGTIHYDVEPVYVRDQMEALVSWINGTRDTLHAVERAAIAHYHMVRIHPFDDGNGRGARILMNLILLKQGYFPAVIQQETKRRYLDALVKADQGELQPFIRFVADALIATHTSVIEALEKGAAELAKLER